MCFKNRALLAAVAIVACAAAPSYAIKQFRDEFKAVYLKPDSSDAKDVALQKEVDRVGCYLCHVGEERKDRNPYGQELAKLLDRTKDIKNKEKIRQALEKVAVIKSKPNDPAAPTYGDLIKAGKLPVPVEKIPESP